VSQPIDKLRFSEADPAYAGLKAAWEAAWRHLQACCTPGSPISDIEEGWDIEPRRYADLLTAVRANDPPRDGE
jgi:hypothetical protein